MPRPEIVDIVVPVTPEGAISDPAELPRQLQTPSILTPLPVPGLLARMDKYGIGQALVPARCYGPLWHLSYEVVRDYVAQAPGRLFALAGIDPTARPSRVRDFAEAVRDWGFVGAHTYPHWAETDPDDRTYYPYYAKAEELGVPVEIEIMNSKGQYTRGLPAHIERVANDFPGLKVVAIHTGYPWERELTTVATYTPNVYVGCDGVSPRIWAPELVTYIKGAGYRQGDDLLGTSKRAVFGTNYLSLGQDITPALELLDGLNLGEQILNRFLRDNARTLFGLPETGAAA